MPSPFWSTYLPVHGRSVAALRRTSYWSGSSSARHSWSLLTTLSVFSMSLLSDRSLTRYDARPCPGVSPSAAAGTLSPCPPPSSISQAVAYPQSGEPLGPDPRYVFITGG